MPESIVDYLHRIHREPVPRWLEKGDFSLSEPHGSWPSGPRLRRKVEASCSSGECPGGVFAPEGDITSIGDQ